MTPFRFTLELHTAFGTPLAGDTLFGQLCWTVREHLGNAELGKLLAGYTEGRPWLVVSDGFPSGYLPKPTVPASIAVGATNSHNAIEKRAIEIAPTKPAPINQAAQRKAEKAKHWTPLAEVGKPLAQMLAAAVNDNVAFGDNNKPVEAPQSHNTLNRLSGTTGEEGFSPYTQPQTFFAPGQRMDLYCVLDESRMSLETLQTLLQAVGSHGYGRDASIGLGKFSVLPHPPSTSSGQAKPLPEGEGVDAYLTLAPCSPQRQGFDSDKSYYRVLTRFGRHGNLHGISEKPFKNPVLLAATGAVFVPHRHGASSTPEFESACASRLPHPILPPVVEGEHERLRDFHITHVYTHRHFIGQGLGGNGQLSKIEPDTVQQGYAPVIGIRLEG